MSTDILLSLIAHGRQRHCDTSHLSHQYDELAHCQVLFDSIRRSASTFWIGEMVVGNVRISFFLNSIYNSIMSTWINPCARKEHLPCPPWPLVNPLDSFAIGLTAAGASGGPAESGELCTPVPWSTGKEQEVRRLSFVIFINATLCNNFVTHLLAIRFVWICPRAGLARNKAAVDVFRNPFLET